MTQTQAIFEYIKQGNSITPLEALRLFNCLRLGGRIYEIRQQGYQVDMKLVGDKKKYAQYSLKKEEKQLVMPI